MTTTVDADSTVSDATQITSADSPYLTQGEDTIQVDTSTASVTVTLAGADLAAGREIRVIDSGLNAGTNSITIETEGTETINPGSLSSISISINGGYEDFFSDGANWFSSRVRDTATVDNIDGTSSQYNEGELTNETFVRGVRGTDSASTAARDFVNCFDGETKDNRGEFNTSQQFVPDKGGEYEVSVRVDFTGETTSNDGVSVYLYNVTDNANTVNPIQKRVDSLGRTIDFNFNTFLRAGDKYELLASNLDSSFKISTKTEGEFKWSVIQ